MCFHCKVSYYLVHTKHYGPDSDNNNKNFHCKTWVNHKKQPDNSIHNSFQHPKLPGFLSFFIINSPDDKKNALNKDDQS